MLDDVPAIFAALGVSEEQVVVFGRSVGSIYAVEAAHRFGGIAGLVLESGIHDVLERILLRTSPRELGVSDEELREEVARHLDHGAKLASLEAPFLLMHCEHDGLVDISHAERNHDAAPRAQRSFLRFSAGDHNSIMAANQAAYVRALLTFLSSCVATPAP